MGKEKCFRCFSIRYFFKSTEDISEPCSICESENRLFSSEQELIDNCGYDIYINSKKCFKTELKNNNLNESN